MLMFIIAYLFLLQQAFSKSIFIFSDNVSIGIIGINVRFAAMMADVGENDV